MSSSEFTYVIPPYLLNTCVGQELHQELCWLDPELAAKNYFSPETSKYKFRSPRDLSQDPNSFCDDVYINEIIRAKLKEKFAVLGVLGNSPPAKVSDEYLFELYEIFKDRLMPGKLDSKASSAEDVGLSQRAANSSSFPTSGSVPMPISSVSVEPHSRSKGSVFELPRYGEFIYKVGHKDINTFCLETCPLDTLIAWARDKKEHKYSFFPYLMEDSKNFFLSHLPMYWTPLSGDEFLKSLDERYGLESDIENGYSVLRLKLSRNGAGLPETPAAKRRFYNFISNNDIQENTGIFYYEVSVEQTATLSTKYEPIIHANDPSLSSGSSLLFSMGFTRRHVRFDRIPSSTGPSSAATSTVDLKDIQADLFLHNSNLSGNKLDEDTVTFLGAEPGVSFEGSVAISFNNSCSYAPIKKNDGNFRTSSLNLNRRFSQMNRHSSTEQETGKLNIDAPFHTHPVPESDGKKGFRTETVGFGVNFIERTLFVTLNGIMVKTIHEKDLTSSNRFQDSIFGQGAESGPLYPMIGFRVADFPNIPASGDLPESKIITNFGLKNFQFNINSYIQKFKSGQKALLKSVIENEITNSAGADSSDIGVAKFESAIRNIQNDPSILNDFIEGYLIQEGFLGTLDSFKSDINELSKNINQPEDDSMDEDVNLLDETLAPSKAFQRQILKRSILERRFNDAIEILRSEFPNLEQLESFVFELELSQYIELLRRFLQVKFSFPKDCSKNSDISEKLLFKKAFSLGKHLAEKSGEDSSNALGELSSVLLLNNKNDFQELSQASRLFERHANDIKVLASIINCEILETQNFSKESRLENMVMRVGENVSKLSSENQNPFRLVNFERDYMDV
ncbi:hypothetical protein JCM33374_g5186 [Metschnikowia sp. JCM 33374]|nr:hypothetical protein JCM33374_g5186 [Metschnikowia sp. JCM 33374]